MISDVWDHHLDVPVSNGSSIIIFISYLFHPEDHRCYITAVHVIIWGDNMFEMSCMLLIDIISTYLL